MHLNSHLKKLTISASTFHDIRSHTSSQHHVGSISFSLGLSCWPSNLSCELETDNWNLFALNCPELRKVVEILEKEHRLRPPSSCDLISFETEIDHWISYLLSNHTITLFPLLKTIPGERKVQNDSKDWYWLVGIKTTQRITPHDCRLLHGGEERILYSSTSPPPLLWG